MDGRVKTLHPKIHGGILALRDKPEHRAQMEELGIGAIDMVVVNLYPFEATVARGAPFDEIIEQIDIGGPAMIRSAAKNHPHVAVVVEPSDYAAVAEELGGGRRRAVGGHALPAGVPGLPPHGALRRRHLQLPRDGSTGTGKAGPWGEKLNLQLSRLQELRYGENPHQSAAFYAHGDGAVPSVARATQVQGKQLSFNNILDADAALSTVLDFSETAAVAIKHTNPCGSGHLGRLAGGRLPQGQGRRPGVHLRRRHRAQPSGGRGNRGGTEADLPGDRHRPFVHPRSTGDPVVGQAAAEHPPAGDRHDPGRGRRPTTCAGSTAACWCRTGTTSPSTSGSARWSPSASPPTTSTRLLGFAWRVCHHVKSNAIVFTSSDQLLGVGAGQMSRVDSAQLAVTRAKTHGLDLAGSRGGVRRLLPLPGRRGRGRGGGRPRGDPAGRLHPRRGGHRRRGRARSGHDLHGYTALQALGRWNINRNHEHPGHRRRRAGTRAGLEAAPEPRGGQALLRPRQPRHPPTGGAGGHRRRRHREARRLRRAGSRRPHGGGTGAAAGRGHRRPVRKQGPHGVRTQPRGRAARRQQGLRQGADAGERHPHRGLRGLHGPGRGPALRGAGPAVRGQGGRPGRRQGRDPLLRAGRSRSRPGRHHGPQNLRRGGRTGGDRGAAGGRGGIVHGPDGRRGLPSAGLVPGPQARLRR